VKSCISSGKSVRFTCENEEAEIRKRKKGKYLAIKLVTGLCTAKIATAVE
jgi:hypothetical protein